MLDEAAALLRDVADGRPIERARAVALADAVLAADAIAAAAARVRDAEPEHLLRRVIELAGLVLHRSVSAGEDTENTAS